MSFRLIKNDDIASTYRAEYYNASAVHDALNVNGFKIGVTSVELLYPLTWSGVFIPILPARLVQAIEAPYPYIVGIERRL